MSEPRPEATRQAEIGTREYHHKRGEFDELRVGQTLAIGRFVATHRQKQGFEPKDRVAIGGGDDGFRSRRLSNSFGLDL